MKLCIRRKLLRGVAAAGVVVAGLCTSGVRADPATPRAPTLRPLDDRGLLDSVTDSVAGAADRGGQFLGEVRERASGLVDSAINFLGVRYRRGGNSADTGFDCSGFTRYVFENSIGRVLPHRADEQAKSPDLVKVDRKDLKPGDLVFFDTLRRTFSHVGIYLGDGKFIHSPRVGEAVRIEDINIAYWTRHFTGARRVPELVGGAAVASSSEPAPRDIALVSGLPGALAAELPPGLADFAAEAPVAGFTARNLAGFAPSAEPPAAPFGDR